MSENFSLQKSKNLQFVGIFIESYPYQEIKFNSLQFFTCSHKFVSGISSVLKGRHYKRGLLIFKFMLEALRRLYRDEFVKWKKVEDCEWR